MTHVNKEQVIALLEEMALLLELQDANPFRIRAYRNAARTLDGMAENIGKLVERKELTELPGIGEGIAHLITEFVETGKSGEHDELKKKLPEGLLALTEIPGLGPKRVKSLYQHLGIKSVGGLEYACKENRLLTLDGFGEKSQRKILEAIQFQKQHAEYHLLSSALADGTRLVTTMEKWPEVTRISLGGSLRRRKEVIRDIDILVSSAKPGAVMKKFTSLKEAARAPQHGETKSQIQLKSGIQVDLRVVTDKEFPYALHHFTGSKEHNTAMRTRARKKGFKMNEYGLFKGKRLVPCRDEAEIFEKLGLGYIPPELRENMGEIEAAEQGKLPQLIGPDDLRGVFHAHSLYSDGANTVEDMAREAQKLGFEYLGMTDHSQSAHYAHGMNEAAVKKQHEEIDMLNERLKGLRIFKGVESDILSDGSLDYPEKVLASFDFIIASVHSNFTLSGRDMTKRIIRAIKNKYTTMIGHLTGRLLLARAGYELDVSEILRAAADHDVAIEINANPHRLDLDWRFGQEAKKLGVKVSINPDAHRKEDLADVAYGVSIARKGWFESKDVINTLPLKEVEKLLCRKT